MKIRHTLDQSLTYIFIVIFKGEYIFKNPSVFFFAVVVVQSVSRVWLFATPWTTARQVSLSFTISWSLLKLMFIESLIPFNHFILCHPLLLPSVFPSIRVFSNESAVCIRWPKYWCFSFSFSPSNEYSGLISKSTWIVRVQNTFPLPTPNQNKQTKPQTHNLASNKF